ncbi:MAG: TlpA family protein disulfide reductase [Bacteroidota bacterium]
MFAIHTNLLLLCCLLTVGMHAQSLNGEKAFAIKLKDPSGKIVSLDSLRGNWVLVDFWASWCAPCRLANRTVRKSYSKWKQQGLEVFGVSLDENRSDWINAIKQDKITWLQVNSPAQWDSELVLQWRIERIPTTYLIDPFGIIQATNPSAAEILAFITKKEK